MKNRIYYFLGYLLDKLYKRSRKRYICKLQKKDYYNTIIHAGFQFPLVKTRCELLRKRLVSHVYNPNREFASDIDWLREQFKTAYNNATEININNDDVLLNLNRHYRTSRQTVSLIYKHMKYIDEILDQLSTVHSQLDGVIYDIEHMQDTTPVTKPFFDLGIIEHNKDTTKIQRIKQFLGDPPGLNDTSELGEWTSVLHKYHYAITDISAELSIYHDMLYQMLMGLYPQQHTIKMSGGMSYNIVQEDDPCMMYIPIHITNAHVKFNPLYNTTTKYSTATGGKIYLNDEIFNPWHRCVITYRLAKDMLIAPKDSSFKHNVVRLLVKESRMVHDLKYDKIVNDAYLPEWYRINNANAITVAMNYGVQPDDIEMVNTIMNMLKYDMFKRYRMYLITSL